VHAALAASTCLRELNVARNALGDGGVAALAAALPASLTTLDVRETDMAEAGAHALMEALSGNATLTTLHVARNPLGAGGAAALAAGLRRCVGVTTLDLTGVALGAAGAAAVGAAVATMPQLTALTLNECAIDAVRYRGISRRSISFSGCFEKPVAFSMSVRPLG
jgi:Ran GTPase-activating protein (RanGAP) involved in mRNA processing and transport